MSTGNGPLGGVTVVDLSVFVAGPMTSLILGEHGADVIKVEPPGGDPFRTAGTTRNGVGSWWFSTNRCKRSIVVDLKTPEGPEVIRRIVESADVLIHGFRSGVAQRYGLDWQHLSAINPRLVHASVSGYGRTGPLTTRRVYDNIIQGFVGINAVQAGAPGNTPVSIRTPMVDKIAPMLLAQAVTAALYERDRSGMGQQIDISMLHSALWWMWPDMLMNETFLADDGIDPGEGPGNYRGLIFETADGYITAVTSTDPEWRAFIEAVGRPEWRHDSRLGDPAWRNRHRNEVFDVMADEIKKFPTTELLERLAAADAPAGPVNEPGAVLTEPQVAANNMVARIEHPLLGPIQQPTAPAQLTRNHLETRAAPMLGAHTREVLGEAGYNEAEIDTLLRSGSVAVEPARGSD